MRLAALALLILAAPRPAGAQDSACLPFAAGERLAYHVRAAKLGARGTLVMSVSGPAEIRGRAALALRSEASVGVGFIKGSDKTVSWVDPTRLATLRFIQQERHIVARNNDSVEVFPDERRWERGNGRKGETLSDQPLDVLSYIYFIRTLPLGHDARWSFNRHLDSDRNPTEVVVTGRDSLKTPAGTFRGWKVEMHVRDNDHYKGGGVIRLLIADDARRAPVRIESVMPIVGAAVMTLESATPYAETGCAVQPPGAGAGKSGKTLH